MDLHTTTNNFATNDSERLPISLVFLFTKDQNTSGNSSGDCNRKEIKEVNDRRVNSDGYMDLGPMMFTSDVSLLCLNLAKTALVESWRAELRNQID